MKANAWLPKKSSAPSASTWPEPALRITRFPSLTESQFLGCAAAFVDSLTGELNAAALALRRLEGRAKGSGFSFEMALDAHRYGALIVIDRWADLVRRFGPHVRLSEELRMIEECPARVQAAEDVLGRANQLLDVSAGYDSGVVEACLLAFQSVASNFSEERESAERYARLGPLLPGEYSDARRIFSEDLAAR